MLFVGERLKKCREEMGLSQEHLMMELDKHGLRLSRQAIYCYETGRTTPKAGDLATIADFFAKPIQYFFVDKS